MTSLAIENDPYILAPPNPNSPVVLPLYADKLRTIADTHDATARPAEAAA
ncbi:hypothetical protein [Streptomyces coeruleorubidus]